VTVYEVIAGAASPTNGEFAVTVVAETETADEAARVLEELWERFPRFTLDVRAVRPVVAEVAWDFWQKTAGIKGRILMQIRLADGSSGEPRVVNYIDRQDIVNQILRLQSEAQRLTEH
jgi:hypothetical protein